MRSQTIGGSSSNHPTPSSSWDTNSLSGIEHLSKGSAEHATQTQPSQSVAEQLTPLERLANSPTTAERLMAELGSDPNDENTTMPIATIGRAGAQGRDAFVTSQSAQAYQAGNTTPVTEYSGTLLRSVSGSDPLRVRTYSDFTYSDVGGRVNRPGQTAIYNAETPAGIRAEAAHYAGMGNIAVVRSDFSGSVVDMTNSKTVRPAALMEPSGSDGRDKSIGSIITGEDPYTHTRALSDGVRAQGADAIRIPANNNHVNVNLLPENISSLPSQYTYVNHTLHDSSGSATATVYEPAVKLPPEGTTLGRAASIPANLNSARIADNAVHSRAGGARYGATGAGAFSAINALGNDGTISGAETLDIVRDTVAGGTAAVASDALGQRVGNIRGGAVVDAAIAVGTSVWSNADAVENRTMSAGDATADVFVDTGVALTAGVSGMAAGAAVGSVVPVVGTAVGAVAGFAVGAGAAYLTAKTLEDWTGLGNRARETMGDFLESSFEEPLRAGWEKVDGAKDFVSEKTKAVGNFIGGLFGR